jgi:hypothetical protein
LCGGHLEVEQDVFEVAARRIRRKDGQNVKAKCGRKLKAGQDHHLVAKFAPLVQALLLMWLQASLLFQPRQPL